MSNLIQVQFEKRLTLPWQECQVIPFSDRNKKRPIIVLSRADNGREHLTAFADDMGWDDLRGVLDCYGKLEDGECEYEDEDGHCDCEPAYTGRVFLGSQNDLDAVSESWRIHPSFGLADRGCEELNIGDFL